MTDLFVHKISARSIAGEAKKALGQVFLKWQAAVRTKYYELPR